MYEVAASDASGSFTYGSTASMTLGAAISYTSESSGFSANGTTTRTSGGSYTFNGLTGAHNNHLVGGGFYVEDETYCYQASNAYDYWTLLQDGVAGEIGTPGTPAISAGKCIHSVHNSVNTFTTGTQQTFGAGVSLSGPFGINLSSQDGFTSSAEIVYKMTTHGHPICGSSGFPGTPGYTGVVAVHATNQD
jgi:hypothetical protein